MSNPENREPGGLHKKLIESTVRGQIIRNLGVPYTETDLYKRVETTVLGPRYKENKKS